jgi:hypothetical protein
LPVLRARQILLGPMRMSTSRANAEEQQKKQQPSEESMSHGRKSRGQAPGRLCLAIVKFANHNLARCGRQEGTLGQPIGPHYEILKPVPAGLSVEGLDVLPEVEMPIATGNFEL